MTCLKRRVALHLVAWLVAAVAFERGHEPVEPVGPHAVPAGLVDDRGTRHDVDPLRRSRCRARAPSRAVSSRSATRRLVRAAGRARARPATRRGRPAGRGAGGERRRVGGRRSPRPSPDRRGRAGSCRASRPPPDRRRCGQSARDRRRLGVGDAADRLDERDRGHERQVADPGDRPVVRAGVHHDRAGPAGARERPRPARHRPATRPRPARRPTADRRTGRRPRRRSPVRSRPAIGWPPTKRSPAASARSTSRRLRARHVGHDGRRGQMVAPRPGQPVDELEAGGRGRRQDDEVGAVEGRLGRRARPRR